jgi:serine/threonine-protein kinase
MSKDQDTLRLGDYLGNYRIEGVLGAGGMGRVYLATDTALKRTVAIKLVERGSGEGEALVREARLAAALNHPSICRVFALGYNNDQPYVVMEHVRGARLAAVLQRRGPLPVETALCYQMQLADAVAHAHDCAIVHGDINTRNIMVADDGRVTVLDFGLAVRRGASNPRLSSDVDTTCPTPSSGGAGTVPYMAPELLRGRPPDAFSDLWALGVVLFEMLTGVRPFSGATSYELAAHILSNQREALAGATLPTPLQQVVERCLCIEPGERYGSVREFAAALDDLAFVPPKLETVRGWPSIPLLTSLSPDTRS